MGENTEVILIELVKSIKEDVNSLGSKFEDRYDQVNVRLSEFDKHTVTRDELDKSIQRLVSEFSNLSAKMEGMIQTVALYETRISALENSNNEKKKVKTDFKVYLYSGVVSAVIGSLTLLIGGHFIK